MNTNRSLSLPSGKVPNPSQRVPYGLIWSMCAWCGIDLDVYIGAPKDDGQVSHGMCRPCYHKEWESISALVVMLAPWAILAMAGGL